MEPVLHVTTNFPYMCLQLVSLSRLQNMQSVFFATESFSRSVRDPHARLTVQAYLNIRKTMDCFAVY